REQAGHLLVLPDDRVEEVADRLAPRETVTAVALFVEVREDRVVLVQETPDPESVHVDDDVAHVGHGFERRPPAGARRWAECFLRRGGDGPLEDGGGRSDLGDDLAVLWGHRGSSPPSIARPVALTRGAFMAAAPPARARRLPSRTERFAGRRRAGALHRT